MLRASGVSPTGGARIAAGSGSRRRESGRGSDGVVGRSTMAVPSTSTSSGNNGDAGKKKKTVIGLGSCGLDYLALVAAFPKPDDKLRTEKMELQGGGNCANALTAAARLGSVQPFIVSRVGNDGAAEAISKELERDGVSTRFLSRWRPRKKSSSSSSPPSSETDEENENADSFMPSPSTYIIVDRKGGTRTCIHTPGPAFGAVDLEEMMTTTKKKKTSDGDGDKSSSPSSPFPSLSSALDAASLVFFDGRLAEAALPLAEAARQRGVPVLVEAERPREGLGELLERATFVTTSASFPGLALSGARDTLRGSSSGESSPSSASIPPHPGPAAAWLLASLPESVRWVSTTLGSKGAILLERRERDEDPSSDSDSPAAAAAEDAAAAVDTALELAREAQERLLEMEAEGEGGKKKSFAARSSTGVAVGLPGVVSSRKVLRLPRKAANASSASDSDTISVTLYASTAASLPGPVVDSTGAGDAFNGALIHALSSSAENSNSNLEKALALACSVAGCNCMGLGARGGLPSSRESVSGELLL